MMEFRPAEMDDDAKAIQRALLDAPPSPGNGPRRRRRWAPYAWAWVALALAFLGLALFTVGAFPVGNLLSVV